MHSEDVYKRQGLALSADMLVFASAVQGAEAVGYLHDLEIKVPEEIEVMAVGKDVYKRQVYNQ